MKEKKPAPKKKPVPVKKKKAVREKKPNFEKIVMEAISSGGGLILISIDRGIAFLVKKKTETVIRELNPGSMTPVEKVEEMTFHHFFIVIWDKKISNKIGHLEHAGIPAYFVETEYEFQQAIKNA